MYPSVRHGALRWPAGESGGTSLPAADHSSIADPAQGAVALVAAKPLSRWVPVMRFFLRCRTAGLLLSSPGWFSSSSPCPSFAQGRGTADFLRRGGTPLRVRQ